MNNTQFDRFFSIREEFKKQCTTWTRLLPGLRDAQRSLAKSSQLPDYEIETPIVYNRALDSVTAKSDIRWIIVADNPGKKEQAADARNYLIGQSGITTENFFTREFGLDFRSQTVIINKTPIHTLKTTHLRLLTKTYPPLKPILDASQVYMAKMLISLNAVLDARIWVMGISELGQRGIFSLWKETLARGLRDGENGIEKDLLFHNHFSMGSFATALKRRKNANENTLDAVLRIGTENRIKALGF